MKIDNVFVVGNSLVLSQASLFIPDEDLRLQETNILYQRPSEVKLLNETFFFEETIRQPKKRLPFNLYEKKKSPAFPDQKQKKLHFR